MSAAIDVNGWGISSEAEAQALAEHARSGVLGALPTDAGPFGGIERAWEILRGTPWADAFSRAMADGLSEPKQRQAALFFFGIAPDGAGGEALLALVEDARAGRAALSADELEQALNALGRRMLAGDAQALSFARRDALAPGDVAPYIAALTQAEPDWVTANAVAIVEQHPDAALPILFNLQNLGRDPVPTGVAIAPHARRSATFKRMLPRFVDNAEPIQEALRRPKPSTARARGRDDRLAHD